jgi:hypothetical protein
LRTAQGIEPTILQALKALITQRGLNIVELPQRFGV